MNKEGQFDGYSWYYSGVYTCWMVVSPTSGFWSPFSSEDKAIKFIEKECGKCLQSKVNSKPPQREEGQSAHGLSASNEKVS